MDEDEKISFEAPKPGAGLPPSPGITPTSHQPVSKPGVWQPPSPEELQRQISQYKVLDLLGRGGMGAVYKGWQTSPERYVAIKILPPGMEDRGKTSSSASRTRPRPWRGSRTPGSWG